MNLTEEGGRNGYWMFMLKPRISTARSARQNCWKVCSYVKFGDCSWWYICLTATGNSASDSPGNGLSDLLLEGD